MQVRRLLGVSARRFGSGMLSGNTSRSADSGWLAMSSRS